MTRRWPVLSAWQRRIDKAIADYSEAIRIKPDYAKAYYVRGVVHRELDNDVEAEEETQIAG